MREADGAIFNTDALIEVDQPMVDDLKRRASESPVGRFRLCLHHSTAEPVQQMIIAHCARSYSRPHRHPGRALSYQMIEGELTVLFFDGEGRVTRTVELGTSQSGKVFAFRLASGEWYMPVGRSDVAVFCETLTGSNRDGEATEYAPWAPAAGDTASVAAYLAKLGIRE